MKQWMEMRASDFIEFNPQMSIKKGTIATKISMDKLQPFTKKIAETEKAAFSGGSKFRNGDTIMARITPCLENGKTAFVDILEEDETAFGSTEFIVMRAMESISDPQFIYYLSTSPSFRNIAIKSMVGSSGRQRVQQRVLENFILKIPSLKEQKKISSILCILDQKIAFNNAINNNLQQQAEALYKDYFVNLSATNGAIPLSWKKYTLTEFLPVITGKKNANISSEKGKYPFFSCSQDIAWTDEYSFEGSAILVAGNGDFNVKWYDGKFEAYQRTYVLIPHNSRFTAWLYYAIKYNLNIITSAARGSVIKFITKGNLEDFSFYAPDNLSECDIIDTFTKINETIDMHTQENYKLSILRDTLLPKLMSGEIDVSAVQL